MKKPMYIYGAIAACLVSVCSLSSISIVNRSNGVHQQPAAESSDTEFVTTAAAGGLAEVKLAELATKTTRSDKTKNFAQMMMKDHSAANTELMSMAKKKGITIPEKPDAEGQKVYDKLSASGGDGFDAAYKQQMVKDHEKTVALFEKEASSGKDADLKKWAAAKLPTLKHHLSMAKEL